MLESLFAKAGELVMVTDPEGRLVYLNRPDRVAGARHGQPLLAVLAEDAVSAMAVLREQVMQTRQPAQADVSFDDENRYAMGCSLAELFSGELLLYIGTDISARYREEKRLHHVEELMLDTEGIAHYGVWDWDITQPLATWSHGLYQIYGLTPDTFEPSYEAYLQLVHPDDRQRVMDATNRVFHQHQPYSHDERVLYVDGSIRYLHTWAVPVLDGEGNLQRLMGVCLDITDRKRAENALQEQARELRKMNQELEERVDERTRQLVEAKNVAEQASDSKSQFLAAMSHEVRTPMNGILGMLELMLEEGIAGEPRRMLTVVRDSAMALLDILNDILDFSKIEAGRLEVETLPVSLYRVVEGVTDTLIGSAHNRQVRLHCYVDPALPDWLLGDQIRLRQILLNLGSNAIKFTRTTERQIGVVRIDARLVERDDQQVRLRLSVSDNGIGMDEATQQRLFEPFTQGDVSTSRQFGGTGLGLSICKRLVELMAGGIQVISQPGQGATFNVDLTLPIGQGATECDGKLVAGLQVIALLHTGESEQIVSAYLQSAGASLQLFHDLGSFADAIERSTAPHKVLLVGPEDVAEDELARIAALRDGNGQAVPAVLLTPRQEINPPVHEGMVRVWAWPLHKHDLFSGLAVAAGRRPPEEEKDMPERVAGSGVADERQMILVAEDNEVNQEIIRRQLEHLGYPCMLVANGRQALEQLSRRDFALLVTDCHMPEMDGFELTHQQRGRERGSRGRLPIVAVTANALRGEAERCVQAGMDDYLAKPVKLAALRKVLERWIGPPGRPLVRP